MRRPFAGQRDFPTTRWTLVTAAADPAHTQSRAALVSLCESYWYPLYAYVRRRGYEVEQAQDLTQDFFLRVIEGRYVDRADRSRGRFRTFLLKSMQFFLADEFDRSNALKRSAGAMLPFEIASGEALYGLEAADHDTPESIFERRWAQSVLDTVLARLRAEFEEQGRSEHFNKLKAFLAGGPDGSNDSLAREMDMSEGALRVAIHRLRKRYRELIRLEISQTVADPGEVESELQFLATALGVRR